MNVKKIEEFDDCQIKEFGHDGNYKTIGCFKEPDKYSVIGNSDFFEYDGDDNRCFNTDLDFEIFISNEEQIKNIYKKIKKYVKGNGVDDCVVFGFFLNGDESVIVCSDYDYSYEMFLLGSVLDDMNISRTDSNYLRLAHASDQKIEEEYPDFYRKLEKYFTIF